MIISAKRSIFLENSYFRYFRFGAEKQQIILHKEDLFTRAYERSADISETTHNEIYNSKVLSGDVLLNITGASIGRCFYITGELGEANVNQHVCIVRPKDNFFSKYLYFTLRSYIG